MDTLTARPRLLKQANLSLIRKVIKIKNTATRAEIANETKISSTTVRSLLAEMIENGEIESMGYDESSGGRKAERYRLRPDRYHSVIFCIMDKEIHSLIVNICGEILETKELKLDTENQKYETTIIHYLDKLISEIEIKSIGIGVPGIVEGGHYWQQDKQSGELVREDIGDNLAKKYGIPVVLENDIKATMLGVGQCYQKMSPDENPESTNMAYLFLGKGCVSASFMAGGRIIRGHNNFAGELGLIPMEEDKQLRECMDAKMDDAQYIHLVVKIISWICGILNPQYVILGGPNLRENCIGMIGNEIASLLPKHMQAEVLYAPDVWHDYYEGMAHLTVAKMFDDIQFIRE